MLAFAASVLCIGISSLPFWILMIGIGDLGLSFYFSNYQLFMEY
jgi:hypothetical protein